MNDNNYCDMANDILLKIEGLRASVEDKEILKGVDLTIRKGDKFGIQITRNDDTTKEYYLTKDDDMVKEDGYNLVVVEAGKDKKPALIIRKSTGNYMISE